MKTNQLLTFEDILIEPNFSEIETREKVDISYMEYNIPVMNANMKSIANPLTITEMIEAGGIGTMHRFLSIEENVKAAHLIGPKAFYSIGTGNNEMERFNALCNAGAVNFIIDVAHGASINTVNAFNSATTRNPNAKIVVGNFATGDSLIQFLDKVKTLPFAVKVGIGSGSVCTTRLVAGVGFPQFSALESIYEIAQHHNIKIISDGGHRTIGDICKALIYADFVMTGKFFAHCHNTENTYQGSASFEAMKEQGKLASFRTPEGVSFETHNIFGITQVLEQIQAGIKSCFSYVGAKNIQEFKENVQYNVISSASILESRIHFQ